MKALQVISGRMAVLLDLPAPTPASGEVVVEVGAVTVCTQWDLHLRHNSPMFPGHAFCLPYTPGQPGHEAAGVVTAVGPGVSTVREGDRVAIWRDPGHHRPGAYAERVVRAEADVIRIPDELDLWQVAPLELAMCVAAAIIPLVRADEIRGRTVGVGGLGPAGLIAGQILRAEGASVVYGIEPTLRRRALAQEFGIRALDLEEARELSARPRPAFDLSIDCVGTAASVETLMDRTRGSIALFGVQREPYTFAPSHYDGLVLRGYPGHSRQAAEYALDLVQRQRLDLARLITHRLPLSSYAEGIDLLERNEAIKVGFDPKR